MGLKRIIKLDAVLCTLFVFGIVELVNLFPIRGTIVDPIHDALYDMDITDIVFSRLRKETKADTNIVIVNVGELTRDGIAKELDIINKYHPKVIGVDVVFQHLKENKTDQLLIEALGKTKNLIMASKLENYQKKKKEFNDMKVSHPSFTKEASFGYANFITRAQNQLEISTCRIFNPQSIIQGRKQNAFGVEVVELYKPVKANLFLERDNDIEIINYRGNIGEKFYALDVEDVLAENFSTDLIKDKIVLLGFLGPSFDKVSWEDKFFTPLNSHYVGRSNPDMYGVVIHANIISMIINEDYIQQIPSSVSLMIAILLCFFNVALFSWIHRSYARLYDLVTKTIQLIEAFLLLLIVVLALHYLQIKLNLTLSIIAVLVVGDLIEIYYGIRKNSVLTKKK